MTHSVVVIDASIINARDTLIARIRPPFFYIRTFFFVRCAMDYFQTASLTYFHLSTKFYITHISFICARSLSFIVEISSYGPIINFAYSKNIAASYLLRSTISYTLARTLQFAASRVSLIITRRECRRDASKFFSFHKKFHSIWPREISRNEYHATLR